jgi:hypothetical protein
MSAPGHEGRPPPDDADFFAEPPPEIGPLRSRATTARRPARARRPGADAHGAASGAEAGDSLALPVGERLRRALSALLPRLRARCTYVGELGVSVHERRGARLVATVVRFADVAELRVTRDLLGVGPAARTRARHSFHDARGAELLAVDSVSRPGGERTPDDPALFAEAAERAYADHVLARHEAELRARGKVRFVLGPRDVLEIGPGFVEVESAGRHARIDAAELRGVSVSRGALEIRSGHGGASVGIFRLRLDDPRAVHGLAVLLQHLVGVAVA